MSLCINPRCLQPNHPANDGSQFCQSCGSDLVLQNRYRVMRLISDKSGFGLVYEAFERNVPKILKVLKDIYGNNSKAIDLFKQEALVLSQLRHAGIPAIDPNGYFQFSPRNSPQPLHCIVMEKIDGPNLREWMRQQGGHPITEKQAFKWLKQITQVLHLVHQKNYFHRDIKPENIMLRSSGQLVLVDFGAAREMTFTYLEQVNRTGGITRISSAGYTPPEQEKGQAVPQSDFYALGCTFIYLLTGKQPTEGDMYDYLNNELRWREYAPHLFPPLADFIDRLAAMRVNDRPKDTQEILTTIDQLEEQYLHAAANSSKFPAVPVTLLQGNGTQPPFQSPSQSPFPSQGLSQNLSQNLSQSRSQVPSYSQAQSPLSIKKSWLWAGAIALLLSLGGYGLHQTYYAQQLRGSDTETIEITNTLKGHTSYVNCLAISPDGSVLISGSADNTIKFWDIATGKEQRTLTGHTSFVNALSVSPDGKTLVSGSADQTIRIWDLSTGQVLRTLTGHKGFINTLDITPDGNLLVSGGADRNIRVWDLATGKELRVLSGHTGYINNLTISPDGSLLYSASADQTIKIWNLETGQELHTLKGHKSFVNALAVSLDGRSLVSSSADQTIKVWDLQTNQELRTLTGHTNFINAIALSPDGRTLVSGSGDQTIKVWDLDTGNVRHTLTGYDGEINYFVITPDWQSIASGSGSREIKIWKLVK